MIRALLVCLLVCSCASDEPRAPTVSRTMAITEDDAEMWVVNPDNDSVSCLDLRSRTLVAEIALGSAPPAVDPASQRYEPRVTPRALALVTGMAKLYIAGQSANRVFVVDTKAKRLTGSIEVGAAPVAVVAAPDGSAVYVVSHEAAVVTKIDPIDDTIVQTVAVAEHPWGASMSADGSRLYVSQFLRKPGLSVIDVQSFAVAAIVGLPDEPANVGLGKLVPNGIVRGVYGAVPRPGSRELWLPHLLLAVGTPQPELDFQSTVFPTISTLLEPDLRLGDRLRFAPLGLPGAEGAFSDVISGPRDLAFSPDGRLALLANEGSEDVMVFDGDTGNQTAMVRPLPGTMLEGIVVDHAGRYAYANGRNSHDVTPLLLRPADRVAPVVIDGDSIDLLTQDAMPPELRLGQRLFYSANSSAFPITQNFWVSCSTCHLEGGTDAVTWKFATGPRDTPSNAGGPLNTGFLFRQALRNSVVQYDKTIDVEQGGAFHHADAAQAPLLEALAAFVNYAIPFPQSPRRVGGASTQEVHGAQLFADRCASCHTGPYLTDSGSGNTTLDLAGPIVLHDIGTCVVGGDFPDRAAADDVVGKPHTACDFDTPTLRGIFATPPYFHDGSAATLEDAVARVPFSADLPQDDAADLVAYLKTL